MGRPFCSSQTKLIQKWKKSKIKAQTENQPNSENSNWQGALKFSSHLGGKSAGSSEKATESELLDSRAELVWEPVDLHSGLTVSSKLLLPLNPFLLHNETDGTCTERRGVVLNSPRITVRAAVCGCWRIQHPVVKLNEIKKNNPEYIQVFSQRSPASALLLIGQQRGEVSKAARQSSAGNQQFSYITELHYYHSVPLSCKTTTESNKIRIHEGDKKVCVCKTAAPY